MRECFSPHIGLFCVDLIRRDHGGYEEHTAVCSKSPSVLRREYCFDLGVPDASVTTCSNPSFSCQLHDQLRVSKRFGGSLILHFDLGHAYRRIIAVDTRSPPGHPLNTSSLNQIRLLRAISQEEGQEVLHKCVGLIYVRAFFRLFGPSVLNPIRLELPALLSPTITA